MILNSSLLLSSFMEMPQPILFTLPSKYVQNLLLLTASPLTPPFRAPIFSFLEYCNTS